MMRCPSCMGKVKKIRNGISVEEDRYACNSCKKVWAVWEIIYTRKQRFDKIVRNDKWSILHGLEIV